MNPELAEFLILIAVGAICGALFGIYVHKRRPRAAERYADWSARLQWWVFLLFAAFFGLLAALPPSRPYYTWLFLGFAVLEAGFGFYRLAKSRKGEAA